MADDTGWAFFRGNIDWAKTGRSSSHILHTTEPIINDPSKPHLLVTYVSKETCKGVFFARSLFCRSLGLGAWRQVAAYWNYHLGQVFPCEHPQTLYVVCVLDKKHDTMPDEVRGAFPGWNIKTMAVINEKRVNFEPKFRRLIAGFLCTPQRYDALTLRVAQEIANASFDTPVITAAEFGR